jgi:carbonic anhydrase
MLSILILWLHYTASVALCSPLNSLNGDALTKSFRLHEKFESAADFFNRPGPWDDKNIDSLLDANKRWVKRMTDKDPDFFEQNKLGHSPKYLWIGCSDARVPANELIDQEPGVVFVHRNIANLVTNTDVNCLSVLQYAVDVLKVKHIIVCGHYDCGGVKAALEHRDHHSPLENWLRNIRDTFRLHKDELMAIDDVTSRQRRLVELNVIEQCLNVFKTGVVQKRRVETTRLLKEGKADFSFTQPRVHALVFDPTTGEAKELDVDFAGYMHELEEVYNLYSVNDDLNY